LVLHRDYDNSYILYAYIIKNYMKTYVGR